MAIRYVHMVAGLLRPTKPYDSITPPDLKNVKRYFVSQWTGTRAASRHLVVMHMMIPETDVENYSNMLIALFKASLRHVPGEKTLELKPSLLDTLTVNLTANMCMYFIQTLTNQDGLAEKFTDRVITYMTSLRTLDGGVGVAGSTWSPHGRDQRNELGSTCVDDVTRRYMLMNIPVNTTCVRELAETICPICYDNKSMCMLTCTHLVCYECMLHSASFDGARCGKCGQRSDMYSNVF